MGSEPFRVYPELVSDRQEMSEMKHCVLFILLAFCARAEAESVASEDPSATAAAAAGADFQSSDVLYAPEDSSADMQVTQTTQAGASYYSQARLVVFDFGHEDRLLDGAELFIDGQFMGNSPVTLNGFLVNKPKAVFSARLPGYRESARSNFALPAQGDVRIYLMGDNAAAWYTTPSFVVGLIAMGASIFAYSQNQSGSSNAGLSLAIGGAGVIALSQSIAHFIYLPGLEKKMARKNSSSEALP